jgi:uncharacterized phage-associated protein
MPFKAKAVANEFLSLAKRDGRTLSPMQLIKLVYFAHGWYLAVTGKPLLDEHVEAWKFGPVIPSVYHEFKKYGNGPIQEQAKTTTVLHDNGRMILSLTPLQLKGDDSGLARKVIKEVWEKYKNLSAVQLSNLTHLPESPWSLTPDKEINGTDIPDMRIRDYFASIASSKAAK